MPPFTDIDCLAPSLPPLPDDRLRQRRPRRRGDAIDFRSEAG